MIRHSERRTYRDAAPEHNFSGKFFLNDKFVKDAIDEKISRDHPDIAELKASIHLSNMLYTGSEEVYDRLKPIVEKIRYE